MSDYKNMTVLERLCFLADEYEKGNWRRYEQVMETCRDAADEIGQQTEALQECLRLAESSKESFPEDAVKFLSGIEKTALAALTTKDTDKTWKDPGDTIGT